MTGISNKVVIVCIIISFVYMAIGVSVYSKVNNPYPQPTEPILRLILLKMSRIASTG